MYCSDISIVDLEQISAVSVETAEIRAADYS